MGQEEVGGVSSTHYRATIDLNRIVDQAPEGQREAVRLSIETMKEQLGKITMPIEVWIGEDGLVRRMMMSMATEKGPQGPFKMNMTMEMFDFGSPVEVVVPDPSQVYDMTQMTSGGMGGGTAP